LIEDGKPVGIILTVEEYELLRSKSETPPVTHPIGEAMAKEMAFSGASAEISDIEATDDVTLEDLGINELPY